MSSTKRIPENQLTSYFDAFSRRFLMRGSPEAVNIELIGPDDVGDQVIAKGARLNGIDYDPHTHALEILLESGDRRVYNAREVWTVEESDGFISSMEIVTADGLRQVTSIRRVGARQPTARQEDRPSA